MRTSIFYLQHLNHAFATHNELLLTSLRTFAIYQVVLRDELMKICSCGEDDLPDDLDLLLVYNANEVDRNSILVSEMKCNISDSMIK